MAVMIRMRAWFRELVPSCTAGSGPEAGYSRCFWRIGKEALARRQEAGRKFISQHVNRPPQGGKGPDRGLLMIQGLIVAAPAVRYQKNDELQVARF